MGIQGSSLLYHKKRKCNVHKLCKVKYILIITYIHIHYVIPFQGEQYYEKYKARVNNCKQNKVKVGDKEYLTI